MSQKRKAVEAGEAAASKRVTSKAKGNGMAGGAGMKGSVKAATYVAPEGATRCWGSSDPDLLR